MLWREQFLIGNNSKTIQLISMPEEILEETSHCTILQEGVLLTFYCIFSNSVTANWSNFIEKKLLEQLQPQVFLTIGSLWNVPNSFHFAIAVSTGSYSHREEHTVIKELLQPYLIMGLTIDVYNVRPQPTSFSNRVPVVALKIFPCCFFLW